MTKLLPFTSFTTNRYRRLIATLGGLDTEPPTTGGVSLKCSQEELQVVSLCIALHSNKHLSATLLEEELVAKNVADGQVPPFGSRRRQHFLRAQLIREWLHKNFNFTNEVAWVLRRDADAVTAEAWACTISLIWILAPGISARHPPSNSLAPPPKYFPPLLENHLRHPHHDGPPPDYTPSTCDRCA